MSRLFKAVVLSAFLIGNGIFAASSVSQWGITFTFDKDYTTGQFANGDYWVLGPVTITSITPNATSSSNVWMVNPAPDQNCFDNRVPQFNGSLARSLPYTASAGQSIVKAISRDKADETSAGCGASGSDRNCLKTAAVLTVLGSAPADNGATVFRPPYCGTAKTLYSVNDLRWDLLPSLDPTYVLFRKTLAQVELNMKRVYLDHLGVMSNQQLHCKDYMPSYGANFAVYLNENILSLFFNETQAQKKNALIAAVQVGIDMYGMVKAGHSWGANGGHGPGRKLPICFAGVMLDNQEIMDAMKNSGTAIFQDDQVLYWSQKANGGQGVVLFGVNYSESRYWELVVTDGGNRIGGDPYGYIDGGHVPGTSYQQCCNSPCYKGAAMALTAMAAMQPVWGHDRLLQYAERWVKHGAWAQPDPCAPKPAGVSNWPNPSGYGSTWGPDGNGDCIKDTNPADGTGRFPDQHGLRADTGNRNTNYQDFFWKVYFDTLSTVDITRALEVYRNREERLTIHNNPLQANSGALTIIPRVGKVRLSLYNSSGELVRSFDPGIQAITWNGKDGEGALVPNGVYYVKVQGAGFTEVRTVSVIR